MSQEPIRFNLYQTVRQNVQLLSANAIDKAIILQSIISQDIYVYADEKMVDTVIRNLISNALKFTPGGGQVTVDVKVNGEINDEQSFVEVSVIDTGVGIKEEDIDKLFKIEEDHSTPGTAQEKGSGLGLIICQEMVQENNGRIWVESELGKGTTVKFTIPYILPPEDLLQANYIVGQSEIVDNESVEYPPSSDEIAILFDLAMSGDMVGIKEQAVRLKEMDKKYRDFALKVHQLADDFDEQGLLEFIERYRITGF
jgi:hypothetical protein